MAIQITAYCAFGDIMNSQYDNISLEGVREHRPGSGQQEYLHFWLIGNGGSMYILAIKRIFRMMTSSYDKVEVSRAQRVEIMENARL